LLCAMASAALRSGGLEPPVHSIGRKAS
jgi:hypothetical protein